MAPYEYAGNAEWHELNRITRRERDPAELACGLLEIKYAELLERAQVPRTEYQGEDERPKNARVSPWPPHKVHLSESLVLGMEKLHNKNPGYYP